MGFSLSISTSASVVASTSVNGNTRGWAYRRESYSNDLGSGVRTTRQGLGQAPVTQTTVYDAQGRPLLTDAGGNVIGYGHGYGYVGQGAAQPQAQAQAQAPPAPQPQTQRRGRTVRSRIISIEDVTEEEERKAEERRAARAERRAAREAARQQDDGEERS